MAYDPLSTSTRHARGALIVASIASLAISAGIAQPAAMIDNGYVTIEHAPLYIDYLLLVIVLWSTVAFLLAAYVDANSAERTSLERKYVQAWERFHATVMEQKGDFLALQSSEGRYTRTSSLPKI